MECPTTGDLLREIGAYAFMAMATLSFIGLTGYLVYKALTTKVTEFKTEQRQINWTITVIVLVMAALTIGLLALGLVVAFG